MECFGLQANVTAAPISLFIRISRDGFNEAFKLIMISIQRKSDDLQGVNNYLVDEGFGNFELCSLKVVLYRPN